MSVYQNTRLNFLIFLFHFSCFLSHQKSQVNLNEVVLTVVPEQPSPVSVLDASFYQDELPVKRISNEFKGEYI